MARLIGPLCMSVLLLAGCRATPGGNTQLRETLTSAVKTQGDETCLRFYPDASKQAGEQGATTVDIAIGPKGLPTSVVVQVSSGKPRLDAATLACVKTWRWTPALMNGVAIESHVSQSINWRLN